MPKHIRPSRSVGLAIQIGIQAHTFIHGMNTTRGLVEAEPFPITKSGPLPDAPYRMGLERRINLLLGDRREAYPVHVTLSSNQPINVSPMFLNLEDSSRWYPTVADVFDLTWDDPNGKDARLDLYSIQVARLRWDVHGVMKVVRWDPVERNRKHYAYQGPNVYEESGQ